MIFKIFYNITSFLLTDFEGRMDCDVISWTKKVMEGIQPSITGSTTLWILELLFIDLAFISMSYSFRDVNIAYMKIWQQRHDLLKTSVENRAHMFKELVFCNSVCSSNRFYQALGNQLRIKSMISFEKGSVFVFLAYFRSEVHCIVWRPLWNRKEQACVYDWSIQIWK